MARIFTSAGAEMSETLHRSENLTISRATGETNTLVEIRFSTSTVRGSFDSACPRCGSPGHPEQWELEGPQGRTNTVWLRCTPEDGCSRETRWSRQVKFDDWEDTD
jgi:hypothetical protein